MSCNPILRSLGVLTAFAVIFNPCISHAKEMNFQREYNYQASEADSKLTSRAMALQQVKRLILEELGTYLESRTEVRNLQLEHDKVLALTAGVVHTTIIDEKWDGRTYYLKAKITADPDEVAKSIRELQKDREKSRELVSLKNQDDKALREAEALKKEVVKSGDLEKQKQYSSMVKAFEAVRLYNEGNAEYDRGNYREAEALYTRAIEADPEDKQYYFNRGLSRHYQKKHYQAIEDYSKAIQLAEKYGKKSDSVKRVDSYYAAKDPNKNAIDSDDVLRSAYIGRANVYIALQDYFQAIRDYDKAIEIDPNNNIPYYGRGLAYSKIGNISRAIEDWKIGARMGNSRAKDSLRGRGISW